MAFWVAGGLVAVLAVILIVWRYEGSKADTYGSAGWASVWTLFENGLFEKAGLYVGDWLGRLGVFYDGIHAITIGQSGSGKGISVILQNLLRLKWIFMIDPGGENTAIASKTWRKRGVCFQCINIFGMFTEPPWNLPDQGFNALDSVDPDSPTFAADALVIAEALIKRPGHEGGSTSYFNDAAQTAIRAFLIHNKTTEPRDRQNLGVIYEYVNSDADSWGALLAAMKANPVCGGLVAKDAIRLERTEAQAPEEFSAIMSTIQQNLSFLADPRVSEKMSRSDVDFSILKGLDPDQEGGVISAILPLQFSETHAVIFRLSAACQVLELQRAPLARSKVLFLIDEAASLGKIVSFPNWLATLRRYRVTIWSFWQNIGQLEDLYGKGYQTIISNCGLLQILGIGKDRETPKYTEELLGQCTVLSTSRNGRGEKSRSETGRPLLRADELRRLGEDEQIVFIGNLLPMRLAKTPYWEQPELSGRYHPNPYWDGPFTQPTLGDRWAQHFGRFYYALVWFMYPHPLAACIWVSPFFAALAFLFF